MMRHLGRLFGLLLIASFVLAVAEIPGSVVIACAVVGLVGLLVVENLLTWRQAAAFYRAVEQHAAQHGLVYYSRDHLRRHALQYGLVAIVLLAFAVSIALNVLFATVYFVCGFFILGVIALIVIELRNRERCKEAWRRFAARHDLAFQDRLRIKGIYQDRPLLIESFTVRLFASSSRGGTGSTRADHTRVLAAVNNPGDYVLYWEKGRLQGHPDTLAQDILEMTDLGQRLTAAAPQHFGLDDEIVFLEIPKRIAEEAELQFLADLVCDTAEAVEVLYIWQRE